MNVVYPKETMHIAARSSIFLITSICFVTSTRCVAGNDVGSEGDGDSKIGPSYTNAPELTVKDGVSKGTTHDFVMKSEDSKIYPGIRGPYQRKACVYIPADYKAGTAAPFIVVQDGMGYKGKLVPVLDNMIAEHRLPAMIAIFLDSGGGDSKGSERGLEYDTVSGKYSDFIEKEVLPKIVADYKVKFTSDPDGRATMGGSSGGAAAFTMGWFHPELYHRILTYSGTFVDQQSPKNPESPHGAWEYHENLIGKTEAKPLRVYLEVGEKDNGWDKNEASYHNWVMANNRMAEVLKSKGYHYRYEFAQGAGHVDGKVVKQTLPEAMEWLWRGYGGK